MSSLVAPSWFPVNKGAIHDPMAHASLCCMEGCDGPFPIAPAEADDPLADVSLCCMEGCGVDGDPCPAAPAETHIQLGDLVRELCAAFEAEKALGHAINNRQDPQSANRLNGRVQALLQHYALTNGGDWRAYATWDEGKYVRHLVWCNDDVEIMLLCWRPGQVSRVHNHADSHCWLAVLDGGVREVQYQPRATAPDGVAPRPGAVYVEQTHAADMKIGDVGYINDLLALHSVGCYAATAPSAPDPGFLCPPGHEQEGGACSLHVYAPPIRRVKTYEGGAVHENTCSFYSMYGHRL